LLQVETETLDEYYSWQIPTESISDEVVANELQDLKEKALELDAD